MIHIKGIKPAIQLPDIWGRKKALSFEVTFTEEMKYREPNNEGADWRKLTGLSLCRWDFHKDTCFIGWRYWLGKFELVPYFHFSEDREEFDHVVGAYKGYFNNNSIQGFAVGDTVSGSIDFINNTWTVKIGDKIHNHSHDLCPKRAFRTLTWFGGSTPPKKTFKIKLNLK